MRRRNFYFRQKVTESELDSAFDDVEDAIKDFVGGFNYVGIATGAQITEHAPTNLTVDAAGPATIYNQVQERIGWSPTQNVDVSVDELGSATTVGSALNERWLSIFAEFKRVDSDPRIDGFNNEVFYFRDEGFQINVVQGAEAAVGDAVKPPLRGTQILLADVKLIFGQTTVTNSDVDTTRTEVIYKLSGTPNVINERNLQDALQDMLDIINGFDVATIAAPGVADSPFSLVSGTVATQLVALLALINDETAHINNPNTYTKLQTVDVDSATTAMLSTTKVSGDDPITPAARWKLLLDFPTGDLAKRIRFYSGDTNINGNFCITVNAAFDPALGAIGQWASDTDTDGSIRILLATLSTITNIGFSHKEPTGAPWDIDAWDTQPDTLDQFGEISISGNIKFASSRARTIKMGPVIPGFSEITGATLGWENLSPAGVWTAAVPSTRLWVPLRLPNHVLITDILFDLETAGAIDMAVKLHRYHTYVMGDSVMVDTTTAPFTVDSGRATALVNPTNFFTDNDNESYVLEIQCGQAGDKAHAIEIRYNHNNIDNAGA